METNQIKTLAKLRNLRKGFMFKGKNEKYFITTTVHFVLISSSAVSKNAFFNSPDNWDRKTSNDSHPKYIIHQLVDQKKEHHLKIKMTRKKY